MVVAVGVNVTFPLAFVTDRLRALPWIGVAALAVQLLLAWIGVELFELDGLAVSLALSTLLVLAALLTQLDAAAAGLRGIAFAAAVVVGVHGCGVRAAGSRSRRSGRARSSASRATQRSLLVVRPRGLRESWAYLRALR